MKVKAANEELKSQINPEKIPGHVAVIMDGNGRWAKERGHLRIFGHHHGVNAVRETCEACAELGIGYLTLYAFSTENWNRPKDEVNALMALLVQTIQGELKTLMDNGIRLEAIGDIASLPDECREQLQETMNLTAGNKRMVLVLALSYSGRWDITNAVRCIAAKIKNGEIDPAEISENTISEHLSTAPYPAPELMIRTSGEQRVSNFLLWELAYSEMYFTPVLWPDFNREHFYKALLEYQNRERRFGKTSDQIK